MAKESVCKKCGAVLPKKAKCCPGCKAKVRKPIFKKWWFWILVIGLLGSCGSDKEESADRSTGFGGTQETVISETEEKEPEQAEETDEVAEVSIVVLPEGGETEVEEDGFELVAGELGEFGEAYILNEGTEFEENLIVFRVPAGTYTVINTGDFVGQFNVYSEKTHITDSEWEESAESICALLLDIGEAGTATIENGQYIEIQKPDRFRLVYTGSAPEISEEEPVETTLVEETQVPEDPVSEETFYEDPVGTDYVLNTNTMKFHYPHCSSVDRMKDENKAYYTGSRDELILWGYSPCGRCTP